MEPGVKAKLLNQILKEENSCFLPSIDDYSNLNIGQMLFQNHFGENEAKTLDYILGLEVILPNGELMHTGSKTLKNVSGYDVTSLYIGSQGIFGIVVKAILRLDPIISYSDEKKEKINPTDIPLGFNREELKLLKELKKALDPNNILNPHCLI